MVLDPASSFEVGEILFPELQGAARPRGVRRRRRGSARYAQPLSLLAAQFHPADLAGDGLGQLAELQPPDPLVRGPPLLPSCADYAREVRETGAHNPELADS